MESGDRYCDYVFNPNRYTAQIPDKVKLKIKQGVHNRLVLPSMRLFWSAGAACDSTNVAAYNCSALTIESPLSFGAILLILMAGAGVGYSVERKYTDTLPQIKYQRNVPVSKLTIEDSKFGWQNAMNAGMSLWFEGRDIIFDYSQIRPEGTPLKTFGGRASGPEVLRIMLNTTRDMMMKAQGRKLTPLECHDICCFVAKAVVVGGVRRSALISLSDLFNIEMRDCKTGIFPPERYGANNSAVYYEKPSDLQFMEDFAILGKSRTGERGIFNLEAARKNAPHRRKSKLISLVNPCFRGDMRLLTLNGYMRFDELSGTEVEIVNKDGDVSTGFVWENPNYQEICEVRFEDDTSIYVTDEHVFMLEDGSKCKAQWLTDKYVKQFEGPSKKVTGVFGSKTHERVYDFSEPLTNWGVVNGCIVHNCAEVTLRNKEFCNLSTFVIKPDDDFHTLLDRIKTATWMSVLQSTFTDFPNLSQTWKENCEDERLCGVSFTGIMDNPSRIDAKELELLKKQSIKTAREASELLGINMPAATTCVKPSGSCSALLNTAAGIHPRWAPYFLRNVQISKTDPLYKLMVTQGAPCFDTPSDPSTAIISFPMKSPDGAITRNDLRALDQLEVYKKVSQNYTEMSCSATIFVDNDEWIDVAHWVHDNFDAVNGLSFFPRNDHVYEWSPYQDITEEEYVKLAKTFPTIDFGRLPEFEEVDETTGAKEYACVGGGCDA
jgi:hypothetical protein